MAQKQEQSAGSIGCLVFILIALVSGLWFFKTESGWTYFYPMGTAKSDVQESLKLRGLQGELQTVRLFIGSRAGYAVLDLGPSPSEDILTTVTGMGYQSFEKRDSGYEFQKDEKLALLSSRLPMTLPRELRDEVLASYSLERCEVLTGRSDKGPADISLIAYLKDRKKCLILFHYRYG